MDLYEYQGKQLFARFGIPVSEGKLATTPVEARAAAEELGGQVVVKAQVLVGGRGKAGGAGRGGSSARAGRRRPRRARAKSSAWTSAATSCGAFGSRRPPTSSAST